MIVVGDPASEHELIESRIKAIGAGRPRTKQVEHNLKHGIEPKGVEKRIKDIIDGIYDVEEGKKHTRAASNKAKYDAMSDRDREHELKSLEKQMIDAARKADRKLMVAYRCRYEPYNQEAIRIARSGELGPLKVILADHGFNIGDPAQWRLNKDLAGGGSLMDIGIYSLQAARYLSGEEPSELNAIMHNTPNDRRFKEVEETIDFQLRFPSGILANCTSSYGYAGQNRYRAVGTEGWLEMEPATSDGGLRMRVHRRNVPEERELPVLDHFALEMDHMSGCVMDNKELLTPGEEGLRDLKIMMAIYEAARTGKTVEL
jgi:predicted dehydrogenase